MAAVTAAAKVDGGSDGGEGFLVLLFFVGFVGG